MNPGAPQPDAPILIPPDMTLAEIAAAGPDELTEHVIARVEKPGETISGYSGASALSA